MILVNGYLSTVSTFPNNEEMIKLANLSKKDGPCIVEWFFENDSEFMQLKQIESCLTERGKLLVDCVIPYFPYERMDRQEIDNPFSLQAAVSMLPKSWTYYVMEPHSEVLKKVFEKQNLKLEIFWFNNFEYLDAPYFDTKTNIMVLPDKGSVSRYLGNEATKENIVKLLKANVPILVGRKQRDFESHHIEKYAVDQELSLVGNSVEIVNWNKQKLDSRITDNETTFIVVDDVISYGNTFVKLAKFLMSEFKNAMLEFDLHVAHSETALLKGDVTAMYDHIFTTNSLLRAPVSVSGLYEFPVKKFYPNELRV